MLYSTLNTFTLYTWNWPSFLKTNVIHYNIYTSNAENILELCYRQKFSRTQNYFLKACMNIKPYI